MTGAVKSLHCPVVAKDSALSEDSAKLIEPLGARLIENVVVGIIVTAVEEGQEAEHRKRAIKKAPADKDELRCEPNALKEQIARVESAIERYDEADSLTSSEWDGGRSSSFPFRPFAVIVRAKRRNWCCLHEIVDLVPFSARNALVLAPNRDSHAIWYQIGNLM